jgi:integrase
MAQHAGSYGDGTIFEKTNKSGKKVWVVEIAAGTLPNGRPRKIRRTASSRRAATILRQKLNAEKNSGALKTRDHKTVQSYGMWWVREHKPMSIKDSTAADYEDRLRRYVFPHLGKIKLDQLSYRHVIDWMNDLHYAKKSARTINGARTILHALCRDAHRSGLLQSNPVSLSTPIKSRMGDKTQVQPHWTKAEAQSALKASVGEPMDLFLHICLHLGLRHGEALGLSWDAINLESRTITVKQTLRDERRLLPGGAGQVRSTVQEVKTKSSNRSLRMPDSVYQSFLRHQMSQSTYKMLAGPQWSESGMVFTSSIGTPVNMANNLKRYKKFLKDHSLRFIRVHDIRHTYANLALETKVPLEAVSQSLGHADIGITKKIYAPNVQGLNEVAIDGLALYLEDTTVVLGIKTGIEDITPEELEITAPVKVSMRKFEPRIPAQPRITA